MKKVIASVLIAGLSFLPIAFTSMAFAADLPAKPSATKSVALAPNETININTADVQSLTKLKGIGVKKAEAIVAWRKANGAFKSLDQLMDVKGIGHAILDANRKNIRIQ